VVTPQGIMSIRLHSGVRVDITADKAIRVVNTPVRRNDNLKSKDCMYFRIHDFMF